MTKKLRIFSIILIFSIVTVVFGGTTGKITGVIVDAESGAAVPGVNIQLVGTTIGAATDLNGKYFIFNIPPGTCELKATMIGYESVVTTGVWVKIDQTTTVDFNLKLTILEGQEIIVTAERPVVERDLTASKHVVSADALRQMIATDVEQVIGTQQGVNVHGGIRGGFGLNVSYLVDGMEMRDAVSNSNLMTMGTSAIQEMEILTGGFNAEYGRANGAIMNIVTKEAREKIRGSFAYRYRPSGIYHWGPYMYNQDLPEYAIMGQAEFWEDISLPEHFYTTDGGGNKVPLYTPEEMADYWVNTILKQPHVVKMMDYNQRSQHDFEGTLYGPITSRLSFMVTGRYFNKVSKFPTLLPYEPEWYGQLNLNYDLTGATKLRFSLAHTGFDNSEKYRTTYMSSEDQIVDVSGGIHQLMGPYVVNALNPYKYVMVNSKEDAEEEGGQKPPEYIRTWSGQLKLTHTFSPKSYLEAQVGHYQLWRMGDFHRSGVLEPYLTTDGALNNDPRFDGGMHGTTKELWLGNLGYFWNRYWFRSPGADTHMDYTFTTNNYIKADLTSQITDVHQLKGGFYFSYNYINRIVRINQLGHEERGYDGSSWILYNDAIPRIVHPYEFSAYIQDKIETRGMIVNVGVRLDLYNPNVWTGKDIMDVYGMDEDTPGNLAQNVVSFGDPYNYSGIEKGNTNIIGQSYNQYITKSPTQIAISPRIGISHPITENTVFHFMYGHFNQRPAWMKMVNLPYLNYGPFPQKDMVPWQKDWGTPFADSTSGLSYGGLSPYGAVKVGQRGTMGNPRLEFERMVQYEVGFDQNIADLFRLDVTMFYRDAQNMTSAGFQNDLGSLSGFGTNIRQQYVEIHPDLSQPDEMVDWSRGAGATGYAEIPVNNGYQDVRGLEFTFESKFTRYFNFRAMYNLAYSTTGSYGLSDLYRIDPETGEVSDLVKESQIYGRVGANNLDDGNAENNNEYWQPHNSAKIVLNFFTPEDYGPRLGEVYPLGDWNINIHSVWDQGRLYTYHSPDDLSTEVNNRRWKSRYNTDLHVSKGFTIMGGMRMVFDMRVRNLFNQRTLRLPGNSATNPDRISYHEEGELPVRRFTLGGAQYGFDNVWTWYEFYQLPREIIWGLSVEF